MLGVFGFSPEQGRRTLLVMVEAGGGHTSLARTHPNRWLWLLPWMTLTLATSGCGSETDPTWGLEAATGETSLALAAPAPGSQVSSQQAMSSELRAATIQAVQSHAPATYGFEPRGQDQAQAYCPAQDLRVEVGPDGLRIEPTIASDTEPAPWRLGLRLAAIGRGTELETLEEPDAAPLAADNRATLTHRGGALAGGIDEWYLNGPLGIEQGFVVAEPPAANSGGELVLHVAISGLEPMLSADGSAVRLHAPGAERALQYTDLFAADADGSRLDARLAVDGQAIVLAIDDRAARRRGSPPKALVSAIRKVGSLPMMTVLPPVPSTRHLDGCAKSTSTIEARPTTEHEHEHDASHPDRLAAVADLGLRDSS